MLPSLARELLGSRTLPREPEPDLVMDDAEQVAAYAEAGRSDGLMAASYLFHTAQAVATLSRCARVVDLGCGPATQLAQIAKFLPHTRFLGVDLSDEMLSKAREHIQHEGLTNVEFKTGDITNLNFLESGSADGFMSTLTLHHLPSQNHLERCFREISRVMQPDGALYLADFARLKSLKSVIYFAYMNASAQPHIFSLDYERSLRAAFRHDEFKVMSRDLLPKHANVYTTFLVPFISVIQTPVVELPEQSLATLRSMRSILSPRYRNDLDELRSFFRLGGLPYDPFR